MNADAAGSEFLLEMRTLRATDQCSEPDSPLQCATKLDHMSLGSPEFSLCDDQEDVKFGGAHRGKALIRFEDRRLLKTLGCSHKLTENLSTKFPPL